MPQKPSKSKCPCVIPCISELREIAKSKGKTFKTITSSAKPKTIDAISEIALNLLQGKVDIPKNKINKLKNNKNIIRAISKRGVSASRRRELINQQGGSFIPLMISLALPLIERIFNRSE
jgi:hypothetical protein